jgi:hypothetical protein
LAACDRANNKAEHRWEGADHMAPTTLSETELIAAQPPSHYR